MRYLVTILLATLAVTAHAAPATPDAGAFVLHDSEKAKGEHPAKPSKIEPTKTDAALKFFVIDKDKGPVKGVVISLTSPAGATFYTDETDADGYAEALVPVGQKYELTYLSLGGRKDVAANVTVSNEPKQTIKLTLRYKPRPPPPPFVLTGVTFATGKATLGGASYDKLDIVVDYMTHRRSAHVEISGHTDNVGNAKSNKTLSQKRAEACRAYIVGKGIDAGRIKAIGFGGERPIAPNDTEEGRQQNRRIEVVEVPAP
jgi:outer membrane protein OmpA-like peptidoglycan-associated protein